jgi:hypothetical protein
MISSILIRTLINLLQKLLILLNEADYGVIRRSDQASQVLLELYYKSLVSSRKRLPGLNEVGFHEYSQTDEDGILLYIFSVIGTRNKKCVEICAQKGIECNVANLIINHGWHGLLIDGDREAVRIGRKFYKLNLNTKSSPPVFVNTWVTRRNVNTLLAKNGFEGTIDLLSLDMDGVDYWIFDAISIIKPRVVVLEYNNQISPDKALTIPYSEKFDIRRSSLNREERVFFGASLLAFAKLARKKGYRLVGCNRSNYNAFFVRSDIAKKLVPKASVSSCFHDPLVLENISKKSKKVDRLPWEEV